MIPDPAGEAHREVRVSFRRRRAWGWWIQMRALGLKPAGLGEFRVGLDLVVQIHLETMTNEQPQPNEPGSAGRYILVGQRL